MIELLEGLYPEGGSGGGTVNKTKFGANIDCLIGNINQGQLGHPTESFTLSFDGVEKIASMGLAHKFKNTRVTSASFPDLTSLHAASNMEECFMYSFLESVSFPKLEEITSALCLKSAFESSSLTSIEFPLLETISGTNALQDAFKGAIHLTSISFPVLGNNFGTYTNMFNNMLSGVTGCTVHFPSALEEVISDWSDVTNGFGGTNTTVVFDL